MNRRVDRLPALSAPFSGLAAIAGALYTLSNHRAERERRLLTEYEIGRSFEGRLSRLAPSLAAQLGVPDDGVEPELRKVTVDLLVFYSQVWRPSQNRLYTNKTWDGLRAELAYWIWPPKGRLAWQKLRDQYDAWPPGFVDYIDSVLSGGVQPAAENFARERGRDA